MSRSWHQIGIAIFIIGALVIKTAPVLGSPGLGFSIVGTQISWEENSAGN